MKKWFILSALLFFAAIVILAISALTGESEFGLFIIFPFIIGSGPIAISGAILLIVAILVAFISLTSGTSQGNSIQNQSQELIGEHATQRKYGGLILVGPIPIAFGSDKKIVWLMMIIGISLLVIIAAILFISIII